MELIFYPENPQAHIKHELDTLKFICDRADLFSQELCCLYGRAKYSYYMLKERKNMFIFSSKLDITYNEREEEVFIGVNINSENNRYEELTYYFAVCDKIDKRILLKIHYDFSGCDTTTKQKHPISHLQIGGRLPSELKNLNYDYSLSQDLDEPRLFHQPMTFALILNLIFNEFPNESYNKIKERSEWRDIIHRDEKLILSNFYQSCHSFISNSHGDKLFTSDFCYGE